MARNIGRQENAPKKFRARTRSEYAIAEALSAVEETMFRTARDTADVDARNVATLAHNELVDIAAMDWVDDKSDATVALYRHVTSLYHDSAPYGVIPNADVHAVCAQLTLTLGGLADTLVYVMAYGDSEVMVTS